MSDKKTAIIFARVGMDSSKSTDQLEDLLRQQVQDCRKFAKKYGLEVIHVFKYVGQSRHEKLIELMSLIGDMEQPPTELICLRMDRFSRNLYKFLEFTQFLEDYGINIRTIDGNYLDSKKFTKNDEDEGDMISVLPEPLSPSDRLVKNIGFAFAQFDTEIKAERVIAAMQEKFRQGYWLWQTPFGYVRDTETREIKVEETSSKIVSNIIQHLSKVTESERPQLVFDLAIKHKLSIARIEKIVCNPFYAGEMYSVSWDMWVTGKHEPLVDWDTWQLAQKNIE